MIASMSRQRYEDLNNLLSQRRASGQTDNENPASEQHPFHPMINDFAKRSVTSVLAGEEDNLELPPSKRSRLLLGTNETHIMQEFMNPGGYKPVQPSTEGVPEFKDVDVLSGRGGIFHHSGNCYFRKVADEHRRDYVQAAKTYKPDIAMVVVLAIRKRGGRFLKKRTDNLWYEIGDERAREKAAQALRSQAPRIRKIIMMEKEEAERAGKQATIAKPTSLAGLNSRAVAQGMPMVQGDSAIVEGGLGALTKGGAAPTNGSLVNTAYRGDQLGTTNAVDDQFSDPVAPGSAAPDENEFGNNRSIVEEQNRLLLQQQRQQLATQILGVSPGQTAIDASFQRLFQLQMELQLLQSMGATAAAAQLQAGQAAAALGAAPAYGTSLAGLEGLGSQLPASFRREGDQENNAGGY